MCGLIFTFPIHCSILIKASILETEYVARNRKYLYEVLLILIAIADPELDLVAEGFLFISLLILTEVSMIIARRIEKAREASE